MIEADGNVHFACSGAVWVSKDSHAMLAGSEVYKVSFTDAAGLSHMLRGVRKVSVSDVPPLIDAPLPVNPALVDKDGNPYKEGLTYEWGNGVKATFRNGNWEPVKIPNPACLTK